MPPTENQNTDQRINNLHDEVKRLREARHADNNRDNVVALSLAEIKLTLANQDKFAEEQKKSIIEIRQAIYGNGKPGLMTEMAVLRSEHNAEHVLNVECRETTAKLVAFRWWIAGGFALVGIIAPVAVEVIKAVWHK